MTTTKTIKAFAKLAVTGAIIFGLAFLAATQDPSSDLGEVSSATADIGWFSVGDDGHNFSRAIAASGLEPRPYDLNGNRMYFAAGKSNLQPADVEASMQKIFVEQGVNSENHTGIPAMQNSAAKVDFRSEGAAEQLAQKTGDAARLLMKGEVLPMVRNKHYVSMMGYDWRMSEDELVEKLEKGELSKEQFHPDYMIKGYKFVDATSEAGGSAVTAVWTDQDFDAKKMNNESFKQVAPDPSVPACVGCERDFRFQSLAKNEPYSANRWTTNQSPDEALRFYRTAMAERGWTESGSTDVLARLAEKLPSVAAIQGRHLHVRKGDKSMVITLIPNGRGGTEIVSNERYEGASSLLEAVDQKEKKKGVLGTISEKLDL